MGDLSPSAASEHTRSSSREVSVRDLTALLALVMKVPLIWTLALIAVAVVSCIDLDRQADGDVTAKFHVGTIALSAIALIWLPALLRLLSMTGGRLSAGGVEASAGGLLKDDLIDGLAAIRTEAERFEQQHPGAKDSARGVRAEVDRMAASSLRGLDTLADEELRHLARAYERLRATQEPGDQRTIEMTRIVNEARVRAWADPDLAGAKALSLLRSPSEGDRIVGLALLQEASNTAAFNAVLTLIERSSTAFEMFHALVALDNMAPLLPSPLRRTALQALNRARADRREVGVMTDTSLPDLIEEVERHLSEQ
jgi:hypothetical protein